MRKTSRLALLTACLLLTAACTPPAPQGPNSGVTPPAPQSPSNGASPSQSPDSDVTSPPVPLDPNDTTTYTISLDGTELVFDAKGSLTKSTGPMESEPVDVIDVLTGEPVYRKHTKTEKTGETDEYGNPLIYRTTALYDLDGDLLLDYSEYDYGNALGSDLIVRNDHRGFWVSIDEVPADYHSELWNLKTTQPVLAGINELTPIDEAATQIAAINTFGALLGVIDPSGKVLAGFAEPLPYYNANVWNGMLLVGNQKPDGSSTEELKETLLTPALEPVLSRRSLNAEHTPDGKQYLLFSNEQQCNGIMDAAGNELFVAPAPKIYINYFDGELLVTSQLRTDTDTKRTFEQQLKKLDGTIVAQNYEQIVPLCKDRWRLAEQPAQFAARRGHQMDILDRQGKVVATRTIPGVDNINPLSTKLLTYDIPGEGYTNSHGLLDGSLQTLVEHGRYGYIHLRSGAGDDSAALVVAQRPNPNGGRNSQLDLYSTDMRPIATSLSKLGTIGKDRFAAVRGFSVGVMDFYGNWVGSTSIFAYAMDETIDEEDYW